MRGIFLLDDDRLEHELTVTTDHPASSYGIPVVVMEETGEALDAFSLLWWRIVEATDEERQLLAETGLPVVWAEDAEDTD